MTAPWSSPWKSVVVIAAGAALAFAQPSCADPVTEDAQAALGPEGSIGPGPRHRAGQPCTVCHSETGGESPFFVVAGTVYDTPLSTTPVANLTVLIKDAKGDPHRVVTNDVGNFYITTDQWSPTFPLFAELNPDGERFEFCTKGCANIKMKSRIGRDGGCSFCHRGVGDSTHTVGIFLYDPTKPAVSP